MRPIVRFAPSPTGYLHVGGARTALINWLIARQSNGRFLLRIEDTDEQRSTADSIEQIISSLKWLELDWDDAIYYQSAHRSEHKEAAYQLLKRDKAYRCFCSHAELQEKRRRAETQNREYRYDGACKRLSPEAIERKLNDHSPYTIRFDVPVGAVRFKDKIHGDTRIDNRTLDDFIILRSDGSPVYQLAVVVDDHGMGVNFVLRGDDHLSNSSKQILLYEALGWPMPAFGHLPLILGPDKGRLSKRHGATSVEEFKNEGILPEALFNYLCLLGGGLNDEQELLTREAIIARFRLGEISKSPAVFDKEKLRWLNAKWIGRMSDSKWLRWISLNLKELGHSDDWLQEPRFLLYLNLIKIRVHDEKELREALQIFFNDPYHYDAKGIKKFFLKSNHAELLKGFYKELNVSDGSEFQSVEKLESILRAFAVSMDVSAAKVIHPLRLALTGSTASPGIFEMLYVLGKDTVLRRIENALNFINQQNTTNIHA